MALYNELHVFIDESGDFANWDGKDQLLIGGVFYWGDYGAVDAELKEILLDAMRAVYGAGNDDYNNLHYSNSRDPAYRTPAYWDRKNLFLAKIREGILTNTAQWDRLEGFVMCFESDVYADAQDENLDESVLDNRYERILEFLVENVFQRAFWFGMKRLKSDGIIHFHIASRTTVQTFDGTIEGLREICSQLRRRGITPGSGAGHYQVQQNEHRILIYNLLSIDRLEDVFGQITTRLRSETDNLFSYGRDGSATFQTEEIEYRRDADNLSSAGYYLADLIMGQKRNNRAVSDLIAPFDASLNKWLYSSPTKLITELQLNIREQNYLNFWKNIVQRSEHIRNNLFTSFVNGLSDDAINSVLGSYKEALSRVSEFADAPGLGGLVRIIRAYDAFQNIYRGFNRPGVNPQSLELEDALKLMRFRFELTLANHLGRPGLGRALIASYRSFVNESGRNVFASFNEGEELDFRVDMELRCAVAYVDSFDYINALQSDNNALELVRNGNSKEDNLWRGRCYGSLGQYSAFTGKYREAIDRFNAAIRIFKKQGAQADVEYELVYLGHVICDKMRDVRTDDERTQVENEWNTFTIRWNRLLTDRPLTQWSDLAALVELATKSRYIFALLVKAMAYFAKAGEIDAFLDRWEGCGLCEEIKDSNTRDKFEHPYELICQSIGILYESRAKKQKALDYYGYGYQLSRNGGLIIELLGHTSLARALRLSNASLDKWQAWNKSLENIFAQFDANCINNVFGADRGAIGANGAFATSDDYIRKAEKFISAIRFNYW